jgi:hypothetical protein
LGLGVTNIGHLHIKQRRLSRFVPVAARGALGDYVPFNFCPRSVMLYVVNRGHDDYGGGQEEIVHLVSRMDTAIRTGRQWAFTDRHAELGHAGYFDDKGKLDEVDWAVMPLTYWSDPDTKELRQAEFLLHEHFPWSAVELIGVRRQAVQTKVVAIIAEAGHRPTVAIKPAWYY